MRDDDVGELTEELRRFAEAFLEAGIPVSYQIIPARLTAECADYMVGLWRRHPDLIEFGQHGLRHEMTVRGRHSWREFGPERSYDEQLQVITEGRDLLLAMLGHEVPVRVFTPPQHKYDGNTVRAAAAVGYEIFSAASYTSRRHRAAYAIGRALQLSSLRHHGITYHGKRRPEAAVEECSIAVAVDDGGAVRCPAERLEGAAEAASRHLDRIGFMLHHPVYRTQAGELDRIVKRLAAIGPAKFRLLSTAAH